MSATLQQRVVGILSNPQTEWPAIAVESDTVQGLYTRYIIPLAADRRGHALPVVSQESAC